MRPTTSTPDDRSRPGSATTPRSSTHCLTAPSNPSPERTQAGLNAARARGRLGGRPKALSASKQKRAVELYQEKQLAVQEICKIMGISKPTLYAYVRQAQSAT